jgi:membrane-bound lytic murein transglycosylase F
LRPTALAGCVALLLAAPPIRAQEPPAQEPPPARDASAVAPAPKPRRVTTHYDDYFRKYSKRYFGVGYDWRIFKAQAMAESNLVPGATSSVGARGLMQLMPSTYAQIASTRPQYQEINDPQWNIAAGILHDRGLWSVWDKRVSAEAQTHFMFASYNAGDGTISRAQTVARKAKLDPREWESIVEVAPKVTHWRYLETLGYVRVIDANYAFLTAPPAAIGVAAPR